MALAYLGLHGCGGGGGSGISGGEGTVGFDPAEDFDPADDSTTVDPGEEEDCSTFGIFTISPSSMSFGLNQLEEVECQSLGISSCVTYTAELASSSDDQFGIYDTDGNELSGTQSDLSETIDVCYKREAIGSHSGRLNIIATSNGATYISGIPLTGTTTDYVFLDVIPAEGHLVWENVYTLSSDVFSVATSGTVNSEDLSSIISSYDVTITGPNGYSTVNVTNESFGTSVDIPSEPAAIHNITYSIPTTKGDLTISRNWIRYTRPSGDFEIRDVSGNQINSVAETSATETDSQTITAGINISNLDVSGPNSSYPIDISFWIQDDADNILKQYDNGEWVGPNDSPDPVEYYLGMNDESAVGENGRCSTSFSDPDYTYCIALPPTSELNKGVNYLKANLCSEYTNKIDHQCVTISTTIIVDNDIPTIAISSPKENQVYDENTTITANITIENFKLYEYTYENIVDDTTGEVTGQTLIGKECLVKLWLNTSTEQSAVDLCEDIENKINAEIVSNEDGNPESGNEGNIRKATFEVVLNKIADANDNHKLTLYTNLLFIEAQNSNSHYAYKTVSFQRGELNDSTFKSSGTKEGSKILRSLTGELMTGQLGGVPSNSLDGTTERAPVMINISEGTLRDANVLGAIEYAVKDMLDEKFFEDLITGGGLKKRNAEGECVAMDEDEEGEYCVEASLHGTALEKVRALRELNECGYDPDFEYGTANASMCEPYTGMYPESGINNVIYFSPDVLADSCGNVQTAAIVFYNQLQHIFEDYIDPLSLIYGKTNWEDCNPYETGDCPIMEWPRALAGSDLDFNTTTTSGIVKINSINMKDYNSNGEEGHFLDANVTIEGQDGECAFCGHGVAYNLVTGGSQGQAEGFDQTNLEDPIIPVILNIDKITIALSDVVEIKKIQLSDDGSEPMCFNGNEVDPSYEEAEACDWNCNSSNCTNKLIIHKDNIKIKENGDSIKFNAYLQCADWYRQTVYKLEHGEDSEMPDGWNLPDGIELPFGCGDEGEIEPILVERNSQLGDAFWRTSDHGNNRGLIELLRETLEDTFKNIISCAPKELVNPMIDSEAFPYPDWIAEDDQITDFTMAVGKDEDGELVVGLKDDVVDIDFLLEPDIKNADLVVRDGGLDVKLPASLGADGVMSSILNRYASSVITRNSGHMYREPGDMSDSPPTQNSINTQRTEPFLGMSLNIEEVANSVFYILFRKGLWDTLDLIDTAMDDEDTNLVEDLSGPEGYSYDNWTIGIDNVILGRFGICGLDIMDATLPPSVLFAQIYKDYFENDIIHLDLSVAKNSAPTIAILPFPDDSDVALLEIGVPNVQIDVKNMSQVTDGDNTAYQIGDSVFSIRLDIQLRLVVRQIQKNNRTTIELYILPYSQQGFYFSMINRGESYNDQPVFYDIIYTVLKNQVWGKFASLYDPESGTNTPTMSITLPETIAGFGDSKTVEKSELDAMTNSELEELDNYSGLVVKNYITGSAVTDCVEGEEPLYVGDEPEVSNNDENEEETNGSPSTPHIITRVSSIHAEPLNLQAIDPCFFLQFSDNDLKETLCDYGIDDVTFDNGYPVIDFDFNTGYLHISAEFDVEVYDWLVEEVQTD